MNCLRSVGHELVSSLLDQGEQGSPMGEEPVKFRDTEISTADAVAFLNSFGPAGLCPVCKSPNWLVNFTPGEGLYVELRTQGPLEGSAYGLAVYFVVCDRCGYVRTHTMAALADWKSKQGKEASE